MNGSYNMPNMPKSLSSRNSGLGGVPSGAVNQPTGNLSTGRFSSNNHPATVSQVLHTQQAQGTQQTQGAWGTQYTQHAHDTQHAQGAQGTQYTQGAWGTQHTQGAWGTQCTPSIVHTSRAHQFSVHELSHGGMNGPSGVTSRGGINVLGNQTFNSGMNGVGGSVPAGSLSGSVGIRGSIPVLGASALVGNVASRISSHVDNSAGGVGACNNPISSSTVAAVPGLRTYANLAQNNGSGSTNIQGPGRQMSNIFQQGSLRNQSLGANSNVQQNQEFIIQNEDFPPLQSCKGRNVDFANNLHQKKQNHENARAMMLSQHFPMVRPPGFPLGGSYAPNPQSQHQQQGASGLSTNQMGTTFVSGNSPDIHLRSSELFSSSPTISNSYNNQVVPSVHWGAPNNARPNLGSYDQQIPGVSQLGGDQGFRPPQGPQAPSDQFGMLGLLNILRMTDPDLTELALGMDAQKLGLPLDP